jgi:hypothetical protein
MRLWGLGSSQLSCHNQLTHYPAPNITLSQSHKRVMDSLFPLGEGAVRKQAKTHQRPFLSHRGLNQLPATAAVS